ncbi:hypothetical protein ARAM_002027 [Aspergillus rambellii]|uniref:SWI/SNF family DNA-dependent ATPase Ris1 n=1 Tax=Aspergillus rambellii TaxID=308745 RepID=A0A0F8VRD1_9EURO|nr:hypothetical protein ARAM_002027 [Aspergillus rambellii]
MASPAGSSTDDVLEELNLYRAILQSLDEQRPDAVDERQETVVIINALESRLSHLRGDPTNGSLGRPQSSDENRENSTLSGAQLDGPGIIYGTSPSSPSPSSSASPPPSSRSQSHPPPGRYMPSKMPPVQKRQRFVDDGDDPSLEDDLRQPPSKRAYETALASTRPSSSTQGSTQAESDNEFENAEDVDELLRIFGVDNQDHLRFLREEQREAEKWLKERKEQERRDAEFARSLMGAPEPAHPLSHPAFSSIRQSRTSFPIRAAPFPTRQGHTEEAPQQSSRFPKSAPVLVIDSDDSDVAEIPAENFAHPGPSGIARSYPVYGSRMYQNPTQRLKAGREFLANARNSHDPLGHIVTDFIPDRFDDPWSYVSEPGADPAQLNKEIKQLLETIRPDSDISLKDRQGTPEALKCTLLEHQTLGLAWMKSMEEQEQKGGILADDMGLGKTIQAISLIVSRQSTDPERKTTLIIAPVALLQQWKREIEKMLRPKYQLKVYILHGEKRGATFRDLKCYDVVLTTFGTLSSELKRVEKYEELLKSGAEEPTLTSQYLKSLPCLGPTSKWYRVIIDEAQCIKNRNTKSAMACCRIDSTYRWCMSGTPMMNSVEELHSLLKFLRIRPYCGLDQFNRDFTRPLQGGNVRLQEKAMTQLRVLLKAVLLRRTKDSKKIDGNPILELPARISEKVHAAFSEDELELYTALETRTQLQFNKYLQSGTVGRNYSNILVLLLRLRQACCHPHLISDMSVKLNENTNELDLTANAKLFRENVIIRLKDNADLECPICMDAVDNPIIFFPCGHSTCAECFARISDPALALRQGVDGTPEVKCPNCRGIVDTKKITDHVTFRKVHYPDSSADSTELLSQPAANDNDEDDDESDSSEGDDDDSLSRFLRDDSEDESSSKQLKRKRKGKGKKPQKTKKTLAVLKKEAMKNQTAKRKYLRRLEKSWITSAKIEKTMEILRDIEHDEGSGKTIIFSQFTSLLDLLEVPIAREGFHYRRYDGSMKVGDRNSAVLDFTDDPECRVMLVSLKAGNSGLNLVAASHVILFDPFWNPYIEEQAIDRAHRIGQTREVHIHRILVPNTVEDRILELQDKKRQLIEGALDENASKSISRLSTTELRYLFVRSLALSNPRSLAILIFFLSRASGKISQPTLHMLCYSCYDPALADFWSFCTQEFP